MNDDAFRVIKRLVEEGRYVEAMDVPDAKNASFDLRQAARKGVFSEHLINAILNRDRVKLLEEENIYQLREVSSRLSAEWESVKRKLNAGYVLEVSLKAVWRSFPASERIKVLTQVKNLTACMQEVANTLDCNGIPETDLDIFWKTHRPRNTNDPLYPLAPSSLQQDIWLSDVFLSLPVASQVDELRSRAESISKAQWVSIFSGAVKNRERLRILSEVPIEIRVSCFASQKRLTDLQNEVTQTLQSQEISNVRSAVMDEFWLRHRPIDQHDFLYPLAPAELRREVWFAKVLPVMPLQTQVNAISKIASRTLPNEWVALAKRLAVDFSASVGIDYFLALMPVHAKVIYFACSPSIHQCAPLAIDAICQARLAGDGASESAITFFWEKKPPTGPDDPLFPFAPNGIQRHCCLKFYANLLRQLDDLFVFTDEVPGVFPADIEYDELTQEDKDLAALWGEGRWNAEAQMLSARTAERVAANFCRKLGQTVRDVSIEQLHLSARLDWRTHDLLIDSSCAIDVKNSRYPMNSKSCYLEHTVPQFKKYRSKSDVLIAGVVSPYLRLEFINNPETAYFPIPPIVILGCTSLPEIDVLCSRFTSNTLEVRNPSERMVPAWLFDYPKIWYRDFDTRCANLRMELRWPMQQEFFLIYSESEMRSTVPKLIAAGIELPKAFSELIEPWQRQFCRDLTEGSETPRVSLPWLLSIPIQRDRRFRERDR